MADPVETNPELDHVVFENDRVGVLEYRDGPGDGTRRHQHPDSVMVTLAAPAPPPVGGLGRRGRDPGLRGPLARRPGALGHQHRRHRHAHHVRREQGAGVRCGPRRAGPQQRPTSSRLGPLFLGPRWAARVESSALNFIARARIRAAASPTRREHHQTCQGGSRWHCQCASASVAELVESLLEPHLAQPVQQPAGEHLGRDHGRQGRLAHPPVDTEETDDETCSSADPPGVQPGR